MKFIFYSPVAFDKWDWRNSVEKGIGGSETSHVEMSWRLAKRGHEVITYAPIPDDCPGEWRNTKWYPIEKVNWKLKGVWILYRCPPAIDKFTKKHPGQTLWFMMQDWDYPDWTKERIAKLDKVITLCKAHGKDTLKRHPYIGKKLWLTSNGIKLDLIHEIERPGKIPRNPKKVIFTSSPDRGLKYVIQSVQRAREYDPEIELHAYYGMNNLKKLKKNPHLRKITEETEEMMKLPGVYWHGRLSQTKLYKEIFSAGIWMYQTNFNETSCISCMEAQAMGAIPIVNPVYALGENVLHGVYIQGDAWNDPLTRARFASELVRMASLPDEQEKIREEMMRDARVRFSWENFVDQWEKAALGEPWPVDKFPYQL